MKAQKRVGEQGPRTMMRTMGLISWRMGPLFERFTPMKSFACPLPLLHKTSQPLLGPLIRNRRELRHARGMSTDFEVGVVSTTLTIECRGTSYPIQTRAYNLQTVNSKPSLPQTNPTTLGDHSFFLLDIESMACFCSIRAASSSKALASFLSSSGPISG